MPRANRTRTVLALTFGFTIILFLNIAVGFMVQQRKLNSDLEIRAKSFALLTCSRICDLYQKYYESGSKKFEATLFSYLRLDSNVAGVLLTDVNAKVLFDSSALGKAADQTGDVVITDPVHVQAIRSPQMSVIRQRDASGRETLAIVMPYFEEWGRHPYSVTYRFSKEALGPLTVRLFAVACTQLLLSVLACILVVVATVPRSADSASS